MYRAPIALLWATATAFAGVAIGDAIYNYAGQARGLFVGISCTSALCAVVCHIGRAVITSNTRRNTELAGGILNDVDQLRGEVAEVRSLAEAVALGDDARKADCAAITAAAAADDRPLATIHQIRLCRSGHDAVAGTLNPDADPDEIWAILDADPGRHSAS